MRIIISPSKKMHVNTDVFAARAMPCCLDKTALVLERLKALSADELKALWKVSDALLDENIQRLETIDINKAISPALFSYIGMQYESMGTNCLDDEALSYLDEHLFILSAFYGYLHIFDAISPYRLEMQSRLSLGSCKNLYDFWAPSYKELFNQDGDIILNLASKEYSKAIERVLDDKKRLVTCSFVEKVGDSYKEKGTYAKMARGSMVRYLASIKADDLESVKSFDLGYSFDNELSCDNMLVFVRQK